jgi:hypothetical protein
MTLSTDPTIPLTWEPADTGEPGDQNAESRHLVAGATSAYYSIGPAARPGRWSLELIQMCDGEEISCLRWSTQSSERAAKATADAHEISEGELT